MALNALGLGFIFTAKDLASGTMTKLEKRFGKLDQQARDSAGRFAKATSSFKVGLGLLAAGAVGLFASVKLGKAAGEFEQGLAAVGAVSKATSREMALLEKTAIQAGIATQFSPKEAVDGLRSLATAGQTATQATKTLQPVLDLAAGSLGQLGVAEAADAVVGTLNAYGIAADDAAGVTDKLLRITQLTNFQTRDFEAGLSKAAAAGATFGTSLEDTLITVGQLRNRNIDASSSSTAFREATRRLYSDQNVQQKVAAKGLALFDRSTGKARSVVDVLMDMADATEKMTEKERGRFVAQTLGARGLLSFNAIANATFNKTLPDGTVQVLKGREAIAALRKEMGGAKGTAEEFRRKLLDTFEGQKTLLRGTLQTIGVVAGKEFAQVLKPVVGGVVDSLNTFIQVMQATPAPLKRLVVGTIVFTSAVMGLTGAVILLRIGFKLLRRTAFQAMTAMAPMLALVVTAGLAFMTFRKLYEHNIGGFADFVDDVVGKVKLAIGALAELFTTGEIVENAEAMMDPANKSVRDFVEVVSVNLKRAEVFFDGLKEGIVGGFLLIEPVFNALVGLAKEVAEAFGVSSAAGDGLEGTLANVKSVGETIGRLLPVLIVGWLAYRTAKVFATLANIGFAISEWRAARASQAAAASAAASGKGLGMMAKAARGALSVLAGPVGLVALAGALGVAAGVALDKWLGLSDGLAKAIGSITGLNKELDALNEKAGGLTDKRGSPGFMEAEQAAAQAGLTVDQWLDQRSAKLAGESTAQRLGLSRDVIRARLAKGEDPYAVSAGTSAGPGTAAKAAAAQTTAAAARSAARSGGDAELARQFKALAAVVKKLGERPVQVSVEVEKQRLAEAVASGSSANDALAFGATPGMEGVT